MDPNMFIAWWILILVGEGLLSNQGRVMIEVLLLLGGKNVSWWRSGVMEVDGLDVEVWSVKHRKYNKELSLSNPNIDKALYVC